MRPFAPLRRVVIAASLLVLPSLAFAAPRALFDNTHQETAGNADSAHRIFGAMINGLVRTHGADELQAAVDLFVVAMSTGSWPASS